MKMQTQKNKPSSLKEEASGEIRKSMSNKGDMRSFHL